MEGEREVEIGCVQNDRDVFMSKEIDRVKRGITAQAPVKVRVWVRVRLSDILSGFSFSGI